MIKPPEITKLLKVKFRDGRTDTVLGVSFINGLSTSFVSQDWITKYQACGNSPLDIEVLEFSFVTKESYDSLMKVFMRVRTAKLPMLQQGSLPAGYETLEGEQEGQ